MSFAILSTTRRILSSVQRSLRNLSICRVVFTSSQPFQDARQPMPCRLLRQFPSWLYCNQSREARHPPLFRCCVTTVASRLAFQPGTCNDEVHQAEVRRWRRCGYDHQPCHEFGAPLGVHGRYTLVALLRRLFVALLRHVNLCIDFAVSQYFFDRVVAVVRS